MEILKKRRDFLRVALQGFKVVKSSLILQATLSVSDELNPFRLGFTATKKIGKAHIRNKTKRRLRASCLINKELFLPNTDYIFVGRHNTATIDFETLTQEMKEAIKFANKRLPTHEISQEDIEKAKSFGLKKKKKKKFPKKKKSTENNKDSENEDTSNMDN
ncbi:MAG: ribonuclease P protein component [Alphaproteobacteria bacterium]